MHFTYRPTQSTFFENRLLLCRVVEFCHMLAIRR